jgi:hypothetical protein
MAPRLDERKQKASQEQRTVIGELRSGMPEAKQQRQERSEGGDEEGLHRPRPQIPAE